MGWRTTANPRTEFVTLRLTTDEMDDLDAYASTRGLTRSKAVRGAVERAIAADKRAQAKKNKKLSTSRPGAPETSETPDL